MYLICPGSGDEVNYAGIITAGRVYDSANQRFTCRECGYTGPPVIDAGETNAGDNAETVDGSEKYLKFPVSWILILGIISTSAIALGGNVKNSILFFVILSSVLITFFRIIRQDESHNVEEDLIKVVGDDHPEDIV